MSMPFSFKQFAYVGVSVALLFTFLHFGRDLMVPVAFSLLFAFILYPVCGFLERWGIGRIPSILLSMILAFLLVSGGIVLLSAQVVKVSTDLSDFGDKLMGIFTQVIVFANENIPLFSDMSKESLIEDGTSWLEKSWGGLVSTTFNSTFSFFSGTFLVAIYTFLFLLYRGGIMKALQQTVPAERREVVRQLVTDIQKVGQNYLFGMVLLIFILGTANSIGLWIIGIEHPFLFGYLAGLLVIIPYAGTIIGGLLPTLYALMTHDSLWVPAAVVGLFWAVQMLEGNFLSPKIIGGKLSLNALTAIFSLILGGYLWGVAGMILFLPYAAILKITFSHLTPTQPLSMLMGDELYEKPKDQDGFFKTVKKRWSKMRKQG